MKKVLLLLAFVACIPMANAQTVVEGVTLDNNISVMGNELSLNGAGLREKFWIDLYVGGLYTEARTKDAKMVINADKPMAMKLHIVSARVTKDKMVDAVEDGFENSTNGKQESMRAEIDQFKGFFNEEIVEGDIFTIAYVPNTGVVVMKNGKKKGSIAGLDFKKALFGIWLGNNPADKDVKKGMLGM